jgi:hypothetical protein
VTRYSQRLEIPPKAAGGKYELAINLIHPETGQKLSRETVHLAEITVEAVERLWEPPPIAYPLRAKFGDSIELLGFDVRESAVEPGGLIGLTLYWRALGPTDISYKVFTHLLDGSGSRVGQKDSIPVGGARPTTGWVAGELLVDSYEIAVDEGESNLPYQVAVGFYHPVSGARLPAYDGDGIRLEDDRLLLALPEETTAPK